MRVQRVHELDPRPGLGELEVVPAEGRLRATDGRARRLLDERLAALHRVGVVRVRLVPLHLCELGRVLVRVALVAEVLGQLVDLLQASDDESLEIELVGDAQVEVLVEQVRVRDERLGETAAVARLQNRGLHLDEALGVEIRADRADAPASATTICVPAFTTACPDNGTNVAQADVQTAIQTNSSDGQPDTVILDVGTFSDTDAITTNGSDPLTIEGAGGINRS